MLLMLHIVVASAWIGLIAAETVMELAAKERESRRFVSAVHRTIDLYFEAPFVLVTLVTGSLLLYRLWPNVGILLMLKIGAGLVAIVSNLLCIRWVVLRASAQTDADFLKWARRISFTGDTIPFGVLALLIGLYGT